MEYFEKRNIYISQELKSQINNDARLFEVFKKNSREINLNRFISLFLVGYYDNYIAETNLKLNSILDVIKPYKLTNNEKIDIADSIIKNSIMDQDVKSEGNKSIAISLKPTKDTIRIIQTIEDDLYRTDTFSQYIRRMLICYFQKPMWKRERIIFIDNYNLIQNACDNNRSLVFSSIWNRKSFHEVMPYQIAKGSDGMFNYLVCVERNQETGISIVKSFRLSRISNIGFGHRINNITPEVKILCKITVESSPQYAINSNDEICVRLSDAGEILYNRIFHSRPNYSRIEDKDDGHYYYFNCSQDQVFHYFRRFDNDTALIISPKKLREKMVSFHYNVYENYRREENSK